jgi:hypothetical protein
MYDISVVKGLCADIALDVFNSLRILDLRSERLTD